MTERQISLRVGRSLREVHPRLEELKSFGVVSIAPSGALYCRRMARETHISEVRRAAAKSRADRADRAADGRFAGSDDTSIAGGLIQQNSQQRIKRNRPLRIRLRIRFQLLQILCSSAMSGAAAVLNW